jgi:hypothetical protein
MLLECRVRSQALDPDETEEDHQYPYKVKSPKTPLKLRRPPGRAVKPEEFVAPVFGEDQPPGVGCVAVLFKAPPAVVLPVLLAVFVSELGSKYFVNTFHSPSVGTCHPIGHKPLLSVTA